MKYDDLFKKAKEEGLEALELSITKSSNLSFSFFKNEIDSYSLADSFKISARGIYNGKLGIATSEKLDKTTPEYLISKIKENATLITSEDKPFIFKGSEKYKKSNVYSRKLEEMSTKDKIAFVKELDAKVKNLDSRIQNVETQYIEETEEFIFLNSYGLKLSSKTNYGLLFSSAVANDELGETKNGFNMKIINDFNEVNIDEFSKKVVDETISQFGSSPCKSGKYKCVFDSKCTSQLLSFFLSNISSDQVQKNTSLLKDKLGFQVCSKKLTISENPLTKNVFFRYFDDEGVATYNKTLIKNGILNTYLYNLRTANKENINSTGNGYKEGSSISIKPINVVVKPGKLSEKELINKVNEGIYINSISGLHSGMNAQSGNFSLIAQGFMIHDGQLKEPVSLITVAGNLFDIFNNVKEVASNNELQNNSYTCPSIFIKSISVSGK